MKSRPSVLPAGYVGMFLVALLPSIWPRVTGDRVLAHPGGDVSPANIPPRKRAKVLARCPVPLADPAAATSTRSRPGTSFEGSPRALHGPTFPRMYEARAHECIVIGDDGTVTVLNERSATEHRAELEVSVGSAPRIGAPPAALKAP
jgi:hypothetical protein